MVKYTLCIATYDRGISALTGETKPYHWLFFIHVNTVAEHMPGIVHQLRGMPGAFYYQGPESLNLLEPEMPRDKVDIGEVDDTQLQRIHDILKDLHIDHVESSGWNCQNWTLAGLKQLRDEGFVYDYMTDEALRNWLRET